MSVCGERVERIVCESKGVCVCLRDEGASEGQGKPGQEEEGPGAPFFSFNF